MNSTPPNLVAIPYLSVRNAAAMLDFYVQAFGAEEIMRWVDPDNGKIGHAEIRIGGCRLQLADEYPEMAAIGVQSPLALGGTTVQFWLQVDNVDEVAERAIAAGARQLPSARGGEHRRRLVDPSGHLWTVAAPE